MSTVSGLYGKVNSIAANIGNRIQNPLLLLLRIYFGYGFYLAGKGKFEHFEKTVGFFTKLGLPLPEVNVVLAAGTELIGGLLLLVGFASRLVSLPLAFTMLVAYLTADFEAISAIFAADAKWSTLANFKPLVDASPFNYMLASLIILAFGPGKWSIDGLMGKSKGN